MKGGISALDRLHRVLNKQKKSENPLLSILDQLKHPSDPGKDSYLKEGTAAETALERADDELEKNLHATEKKRPGNKKRTLRDAFSISKQS